MWAQGKQWNPMSMDAAAYQNMSHESGKTGLIKQT